MNALYVAWTRADEGNRKRIEEAYASRIEAEYELRIAGPAMRCLFAAFYEAHVEHGFEAKALVICDASSAVFLEDDGTSMMMSNLRLPLLRHVIESVQACFGRSVLIERTQPGYNVLGSNCELALCLPETIRDKIFGGIHPKFKGVELLEAHESVEEATKDLAWQLDALMWPGYASAMTDNGDFEAMLALAERHAAPYTQLQAVDADYGDPYAAYVFAADQEAIEELPRVEDSDEAKKLGTDCVHVNDHGYITVFGGDGSILLERV